MLSVLIIDSHVDFRAKIADLLRDQHDFIVLGEAGTVTSALRMIRELCPDLILMDSNLPGENKRQTVEKIMAIHPGTSIVILTEQIEDDVFVAAIRSGAKGYLLKSLAEPQLLASLRGIQVGQAAISRNMASRLMAELVDSNHTIPSDSTIFDRLTPREMEVLRELLRGGTNREIALRLFISEFTVKNHIHSILNKLKVGSRREAATRARKYGLRVS